MGRDSTQYTDELGFTAPLPANDPQRLLPEPGFATGPEIGELLPTIELPAADGSLVNLHEDRAGSKAAVMFFRSAVW